MLYSVVNFDKQPFSKGYNNWFSRTLIVLYDYSQHVTTWHLEQQSESHSCPMVHVRGLHHNKVRAYSEAKEGVWDSLEEQFYLRFLIHGIS